MAGAALLTSGMVPPIKTSPAGSERKGSGAASEKAKKTL
jgi:hypothetical protein